MSYQPRFKPEVYLKILNYADATKFCSNVSLSTSTNIQGLVIWIDGGIYSLEGSCIEECLDQAILETGFDKTL